MLVRELEDGVCPRCGATLGLGLKEEPTGWKVYRVCLAEADACGATRVGNIPRGGVEHFDDVVDKAAKMVERG